MKPAGPTNGDRWKSQQHGAVQCDAVWCDVCWAAIVEIVDSNILLSFFISTTTTTTITTTTTTTTTTTATAITTTTTINNYTNDIGCQIFKHRFAVCFKTMQTYII